MDDKNKKLMLLIVGLYGFAMFVWIILPELSSFWKCSFFLVFSVGMVVFLEEFEKKSKKMAEGKQTKFPFIRDRHWQAIEPCRKEYNKLMELTPKYNQYLDDLGLTNQWEIELELGEEPDIIYILYKGSNMQADNYLSKLNYCVQYLNHKDVLKRLVDSLAEEIKAEFPNDITVARRAFEIATDVCFIEENFFDPKKMVFKHKDNDIPYFTIELTQEALEALYKRVRL